MQVVCVVMSSWRNEAKGDKYDQGLNFHCVCGELDKAVEVINELIPCGTNKVLKNDEYALKEFDVDSPENNYDGIRDRMYISQRTEYGESPETTYITDYYVQFVKVL